MTRADDQISDQRSLTRVVCTRDADDMSVVVPYRDLNPDPYHGKPQNLTNLTMYSFFDIDRLLDAIVKIGMVRAWPSLAAVSALTH